jgi:hypothetical protein
MAASFTNLALEYVLMAIGSFDSDPPDSDYQRGYLAALECVRDEAFSQTGQEA